MMIKPTPSKIFTLVMFLAIMSVSWASICTYRSEARRSLPTPANQAREISDMLAEELQALHSDVPPPISQYQAVTEQNLFSPDRKAWEPPQAAPEPEPEQAVDAPPPPVSGPQRIRLYGTTIGPERRTALLFFQHFASRQKHRLVEEGETVHDDGDGARDISYILKSLESERAVLEDNRGQKIVVGLYDHERAAIRDEGVQAPQPDTAQPAPPAQKPDDSPPVADPIRRMEDIPRELEERERLAKEGRLRRISTPFGPVFRPIED